MMVRRESCGDEHKQRQQAGGAHSQAAARARSDPGADEAVREAALAKRLNAKQRTKLAKQQQREQQQQLEREKRRKQAGVHKKQGHAQQQQRGDARRPGEGKAPGGPKHKPKNRQPKKGQAWKN